MSDLFTSVVIITNRDESILEQTVSSIIESAHDGQTFEIVLVDHARETPPNFLSRYEVPTVHAPKEFEGIAAARNHGVRRSNDDADVVAFIDDDAVAIDGWLSRIAFFFADHPDVDILAGSIEQVPNDTIASTFQQAFERHDPTKYNLPIGANMAFRSSVFDTREFDPRFDIGYDDFDFAYGLQESGHTCHFNPEIRVKHEDSQSLSKFLMRGFQSSQRAVLFFNKYRQNPFHVDDVSVMALVAVLFTRRDSFGALVAVVACGLLSRSVLSQTDSISRALALFPLYVVARCLRTAGKLLGLWKWGTTDCRRS